MDDRPEETTPEESISGKISNAVANVAAAGSLLAAEKAASKNKPGESEDAASGGGEPANKSGGAGIGNKKNGSANPASSANPANPASAATPGKGLFSGNGKKDSKSSSQPKASNFAKTAPLFIIVILIVVIAVVAVATPLLMVGSIDYNLQDSLGFSDTTAIIEEQGLNIVEEDLSEGRMPSGFSSDLADAGIIVGQVTASGDFIKTNTYVADIDQPFEVAATNLDYYKSSSDGELAVLFEGRVIPGSEFVVAAKSDPRLYAAYSEALNISARFYYSDEVDQVYQELGLSRGAFNSWESTGNYQTDEASFVETLQDILNNDGSSSMSSCEDQTNENDESKGDCRGDITLSIGSDASDVINNVVSTTKGSTAEDATRKAAQLLNTAISSNEPRQAASAFLAVEEPIQRARIDGDGPVNQLMNVLSKESTTTYTDVNTNQQVTEKKSVLETVNFVAAVSKETYSRQEANNFSRDRVLIATETAEGNEETIKGTTINNNKGGKSSIVMRLFGGATADQSTMSRATSSVAMSATGLGENTFSSVVGGNRIVEGGSYLSNTINARTLGAMPSDAETIAKYQHEVDIVLARKAAADRATLSPFDISSPNTFMGSIVHDFAMSMISRSAANSKTGLVSAVGTVADLTNNSVNNLFGSAIADGSEQKFTTLAGDCSTVTTVGVEGDSYCNSHNTISTKYMSRTKEQWISALGGSLDSDGKVVENGELSKFIKLGMDREATVGVKSATVCDASSGGGILARIAGFFGILKACDGVPEEIATGKIYTLSSSNTNLGSTEQYSGFALYDMVSSLINESRSSISEYKEDYYKANPKDTSAAGQIARFSGMTKDEAELALSYASYLTIIANYHPADRLQFGGPIFDLNEKVSFVHDEKTKENLYCFWCGRFERSEERNRSFAA